MLPGPPSSASSPARPVGAAVPVVVPTAVLLEALSALAGAGDRLAVAEAALPLLLELPGVRAAAVVERSGPDAVVQGSAGYGCDDMGPGTRLPLHAGLPVTEAVRTGRTVVRGAGPAGSPTGPSWVAAPFARPQAGALLLSLHAAPPQDLAPVVTLAQAVGRALARVRRTELALADLAVLTAGASPAVSSPPPPGVAVRSRPLEGGVGGDVLLCLPDERGGRWLVMADVCGSGVAAALVAQSVATAVRALAPHAAGPAELLTDLDRSLRPVVAPGSFVTAVVVHQSDGGVVAACAGHPPPLLLSPSGASAVDLPVGLPLGLETGRDDGYRAVRVAVPPDALLLLHTDGLVDREGARGTEPVALLHAVVCADAASVADALLTAAERVGPPTDDVALLVAGAFRLGSAG